MLFKKVITSMKNKSYYNILYSFIQNILNVVDGNPITRKKSLDGMKENGFEIDIKYKAYEHEIEELKKVINAMKQGKQSDDVKLHELSKQITEQTQLINKLMEEMEEFNESHATEIKDIKKNMENEMKSKTSTFEETTKELKEELEAIRERENYWKTQDKKLNSQLTEKQILLEDFMNNYVKKDVFDDLKMKMTEMEMSKFEMENQIALEQTKVSTYEIQIDKLKKTIKEMSEQENELILEKDLLVTTVTNLSNELRHNNLQNRNSNLALDDKRNSTNSEIEESGLNPMFISKNEDDSIKKIEEMQKSHHEQVMQLQFKISDLLRFNENQNKEIIKLKEEKNAIKNEISTLKRPSVLGSSKDIPKPKKHEMSEEFLEKYLGFEQNNIKLKEENRVLHSLNTKTSKKCINNCELMYTSILSYLKYQKD